jgi:2',3'-cyclic-nucleotide 2'-phosphodiesterase (5'-nucleotidase family)
MVQSRTGSSNTPGALRETLSRGTISATHEVTSGLPHSTQEIRTEAVTGNVIAVNHQPQVPKVNQQGAVQVSSGKRKESQQTAHSGTQALDMTQFCGATATPVDSDNQSQQVKRRRTSQETGQGYPSTGDTRVYSADTVAKAFPEAVVARQLPSASSNLDSQAQRRLSTSGGGSELWQPPVTSQSYQQNISRSSQSQTPDMSPEQASQSPHMPSPAVK